MHRFRRQTSPLVEPTLVERMSKIIGEDLLVVGGTSNERGDIGREDMLQAAATTLPA